MKKIIILSLSLILLLTGCAPNFNKQEEVVQDNKDTKEKAIIPNYKISDNYYQTFVPYIPSKSRGLVVNNINSKFNLTEFETGLMRVAQNKFDTDKYVFQEGQIIETKQIRSWLNRKYTAEQLKEKDLKEEENIGLNPVDNGKEETPKYLAHILELYYYQKVQFGAWYETKIPHAELEKEGKKLADEVLKRLRKMDDLKDVPITIALFEQQSKTSVVPGTFFAYANAEKGSANLGGWEKVNEKYLQFPSTEASESYRDDSNAFLNFKQDVETYFPNFNGVIGKAFYVNDQLQELNINIPIQFYGKAEGIGFTQYVTGLVVKHFPAYISVQVEISSVNGPEGLIVRKADQNEPFVHIYQ